MSTPYFHFTPMNKLIYPLAQVLEVKINRVKEAEKVVRQKKEEFDLENRKLKKREEERDKVLDHRNDKLTQLREILDGETTAPEIEQIKLYLQVVNEDLQKEEVKVKKQEAEVEVAKKNLVAAENKLLEKKKEVEKLEEHKKEWLKEAKKEFLKEEAKQQDEVGETTFLSNKFRNK
jgi:flagellar biosynthesis chaperone FliJ